jgi:serine/threonine-protein kinase HipA
VDDSIGGYEVIPGIKLRKILSQGHWLLPGRDKADRLSLTGAQGKMPLYLDADGFHLSHKSSPTNVIIKLNSHPERYPNLIENEYFCLSLAKSVGMSVPKTELKSVQGLAFLVSHRYDRILGTDKWYDRLHQEDFNQALGLLPQNKYEKEGGPSLKDCSRIVREHLTLLEAGRFLDWVLFNLCTGNCDAHVKTISLLYTHSGSPELAPFYDLLCTMAYSSLSSDFAMKVGTATCHSELNAKTFEALAKDLGYSTRIVRKRALEISAIILLKLDEVAQIVVREGSEQRAIERVLSVVRNCAQKIQHLSA